MKPWKRVEPTTVTKVGWRTITSKTFIMSNGEKAVFDTIWPDGQECAAVIALTPENKVIIGRMFRPGPELIMDELPAGFVDEGETPEEAVRRELTEETGYEAGEIQYIGESHKDAYYNATYHYFLAFDCEKVAEQQLENEEEIEIHEITIAQLIENAKTDRLTDVPAVMMAYDKLKEIEAEGK
jgi:ADP-ribose pyrophosphatase